MAEVIGVRFKNLGKIYFFDPKGEQLSAGDRVIVETARGVECGEVAAGNYEVAEEKLEQPLKAIIRVATEADLERERENVRKAKEAFGICQKKIAAHGLEMKLVDAAYTFDNSKILFYFTADGRVDFRELVKDLASVFRTRIELRQIGVRDEAKMLGGLGICGRPLCCSQFLNGFQPVSIKMAKEQGLSLNPVKISGTCGRLMCCLKYEQEAYQDLQKNALPIGTPVSTPAGRGTVVEVGLIAGTVKIRLDNASQDAAPITVPRAQTSVIDKDAPPEPPAKHESGHLQAFFPDGDPQPAPPPQQKPARPRGNRPRGGQNGPKGAARRPQGKSGHPPRAKGASGGKQGQNHPRRPHAKPQDRKNNG